MADNQDYNAILNMKVRCQVLLEDFDKILRKMEAEGKRKPRQKKNEFGLTPDQLAAMKSQAEESFQKRVERRARKLAESKQ